MKAETRDSVPVEVRANRFDLLSRMADDLAHEIKNPLNAIVINLEVLKVRLARGDADAALERSAVIEQETRRLHGMVDRLLHLLRPSSAADSHMALDQVLDEVLPLFATQARLARNEFACEGDTSAYVAVGRDSFKFALLNVLNAVHDGLGAGGGSVVIGCEPGSEHVRLSIRAVPADGGSSPPEGLGDALRMAGVLLAADEATVEEAEGVVSILLPRGS